MKTELFRKQLLEAAIKTLEQGCRSRQYIPEEKTHVCKYQTSDGKRCAIGHMMTPQEVKLYGDTIGSVTCLRFSGWRRGQYTDEQVGILGIFQDCHDSVHFDHLFQKEFMEYLGKKRYSEDLSWIHRELTSLGYPKQ